MRQFEGYSRANGDQCDLLSMGGLCGLVESKHAEVPEPSRLRLLGFVGDCDRRPLRLQQFALPLSCRRCKLRSGNDACVRTPKRPPSLTRDHPHDTISVRNI